MSVRLKYKIIIRETGIKKVDNAAKKELKFRNKLVF